VNQAQPSTEEFYITGGTLRPDASCYVERKADQDLFEHLVTAEFCYVLTSRQMGKSSLMVRTARRLRDHGIASAVVDLTAIGQNLTPEQWYDGLSLRLGSQLRLEDPVEDFWQDNQRLGPCQRWFAVLKQCVLPRMAERADANAAGNRTEPLVVIFIDELDAVRSLPFSTDEFFAAVREIYHGRAQQPELAKVAFCLLGVAAPHELMKDPKRTPFSLGQRIELIDFSEAEAKAFAPGLAQAYAPATASKLLQRVLHWTSGHPTSRNASAARWSTAALAAHKLMNFPPSTPLAKSCFSREKPANPTITWSSSGNACCAPTDLALLLDLCDRILRGEPVRYAPDRLLISELELAGVVRLTRDHLVVRNRIYDVCSTAGGSLPANQSRSWNGRMGRGSG
jgi:hypothetical protein